MSCQQSEHPIPKAPSDDEIYRELTGSWTDERSGSLAGQRRTRHPGIQPNAFVRSWPSGRDRRRHRMHPSTRRSAADCLRTCRAVRRWPFSARGFPADAGRRAEHRRRHLKVDRPSPIRSSSGEDNSPRTVVSVQVARGKVTHHVSAASRYRRQGRAPASTAAQSRARVAPRRSRTGLAGRVGERTPADRDLRIGQQPAARSAASASRQYSKLRCIPGACRTCPTLLRAKPTLTKYRAPASGPAAGRSIMPRFIPTPIRRPMVLPLHLCARCRPSPAGSSANSSCHTMSCALHASQSTH